MAAPLAAESAQTPAAWAELEALLRTLDKSSNRLDSLDSIRDAVKANGCLPDAPLRTRLLSAASSCASDPNSRIASKWLQVDSLLPRFLLHHPRRRMIGQHRDSPQAKHHADFLHHRAAAIASRAG